MDIEKEYDASLIKMKANNNMLSPSSNGISQSYKKEIDEAVKDIAIENDSRYGMYKFRNNNLDKKIHE